MLINLRNALMTGKRTPTAKDYVQDGLIAMWDGIENAGWGVHSDSPSYWIDLTGGDANWIMSSSAYGIGNDYVELKSAVGSSGVGHCTPNWSAADIVTCEIVLDQSALAPLSNIAQILSVALSATYYPRGSIFISAGRVGLGFNTYPSVELSEPSAISMVYNNSRAMLNGNFVTTGKFDKGLYVNKPPVLGVYSGTLATGMRIKNFRFYNRTLSDDERTANHAVDKARFGLP